MLRDEGILALVQQALGTDKHQDDATTFRGSEVNDIMDIAYKIGITTPTEVLEALVSGDFLAHYRNSRTLRKILEKMRIQSSNDRFPQPAQYANFLVDDRGFSPTPNELLRVADEVTRYCDPDLDKVFAALSIDNYRTPRPRGFPGQQTRSEVSYFEP